MASRPPDHYICPITQDVMCYPVIVEHNGHPYWFDRDALETYLGTDQADKNPISRETGFSRVPAVLDEALQDEILKSEWAPSVFENRPFKRPHTAQLAPPDTILMTGPLLMISSSLPPPIANEIVNALRLLDPIYNNE